MKERLYRSSKDKIIGGVAGGMAEYFEIDPVIVRILFVVTAFVSGVGFLAYIILWIVVPLNPENKVNTEEPITEIHNPEGEIITPDSKPAKSGKGVISGIILIVIGMMFLADNFVPNFSFEDYWSLILVAIGAGLLLNSFKKN